MFYSDGIHDDTAALQSLLDKRGIVTLDIPGTYLVTKTLIIHSNTRFILSPGAKLLAADGSRCAIIENEHFAGGGRDENISIVGGIFDGNCDNMGLDAEYEALHRLDDPYSPELFKGKLLRFCHLDRITLGDMTVKDPVSYGVQIGDVRGFSVRNIFFDYNRHFGTTDGVHINGPAQDGVIENLCGTTNDDLVSLTTYDEPHAEVSIGDIKNVVIRDISADNGYSAVRLLAGENCALTNVTIDGVFGTFRHHAVVISNHNKRPGTTWFDGLILQRIYASKSNTPLSDECFVMWDKKAANDAFILFGEEACCGDVVIRDVLRTQDKSIESFLFEMKPSASINRLLIDNVRQSLKGGAVAPFEKIDGKIGELIEINVDKREV